MSQLNKPIKILFITRSYGQYGGGMERFSYELIQEISKLPDVETKVLSHKGYRATSPLFSQLIIPKALWHARRADVIHMGDPMLSLCGWLIKFLLNKPVAVTVHGLDISFSHVLYQFYLKVFFSHFDLCLPISNHVANLVNSKFKGKLSRVKIIHPGIHDRFFDPGISKENLFSLLRRYAKYEIRNTKYFLFTSGRLIKRKGHAWFIANVLPKLPYNTIYIIAGDGPEKANIINTAQLNNLGVVTSDVSQIDSPDVSVDNSSKISHVILLGHVKESELKILYNTVDAFIQPNISVPNDVEGFGLVMLEAALCNRPVFASSINGIPDAIHDRQNGRLLKSQNAEQWTMALTEFINNPKISPQSRTYTSQNFTWSAQARKYFSSLKSLI